MRLVWGGDYNGYLDYVTSWIKKSVDYLAEKEGEFAFVSTNSITQGIQVPYLFEPLYREGWRVKFAHRSFTWNLKVEGKAAVDCNITGFTKDTKVKQRLWEYPDPRGEAVEVEVRETINPYLFDGADVFVKESKMPLSEVIEPAVKGFQPTDDGNLLINDEFEYANAMDDPIAARYVKPFLSTNEFLRGEKRWCLWFGDGDYDAREVKKSGYCWGRIMANHMYRSHAPETGDAYKLRNTPHLMRPNKNAPVGNYLFVPATTTENREYITAKQVMDGSITGNSAYTITDSTGLQFGLISSAMFMAWQDHIGGRFRTGNRFANTITWHTFPVPTLTEQQKQRIIEAGEKVQAARDNHPDWNLVDLYNPLTMPLDLRKAHEELDREVDKALGAERKCTNNKQRIKILFQRYQELTNPN